jgi:peroxiredoxin
VESDRAHKAFGEQVNLDFPLLSDFNREVVEQYGIQYGQSYDTEVGNLATTLDGPGGALQGMRGMSKRAVFVIAPDSSILYKWVTENPLVAPNVDHVIECIEENRQLLTPSEATSEREDAGE